LLFVIQYSVIEVCGKPADHFLSAEGIGVSAVIWDLKYRERVVGEALDTAAKRIVQ
jgi:hypothetical protein